MSEFFQARSSITGDQRWFLYCCEGGSSETLQDAQIAALTARQDADDVTNAAQAGTDAGHDTAIGSLTSRQDADDTTNVDQDTAIGVLQSTVTTQGTTLSSVQLAVAAAQADVAALGTQVDGLNAGFNLLDEQVTAQGVDISALQTSQADQDALILAIQGANSAQSTDIGALQSGHATQAEQIATLVSQVAALMALPAPPLVVTETAVTNAQGRVTIPISGFSAPPVVGVSVVDPATADAVSYHVSIESISATQVVARAWRSTSVVIGGNTVAAAAAGVTIHAICTP